MHQSVVEVGTGVCRDIKRGARGSRDLRRQIIDARRARTGSARRRRHASVRATGATQEIYPDERYEQVVEDLQMVARANLIFGLHVHVGIEDRETRDPAS